jgi:hypothetical protein
MVRSWGIFVFSFGTVYFCIGPYYDRYKEKKLNQWKDMYANVPRSLRPPEPSAFQLLFDWRRNVVPAAPVVLPAIDLVEV